ncbi:response regulator [Saccharibacillus sp. CPCC 101409]|uniref:response regulator n=1 Tax=Saccharibacillus sp. CPCC 101409 TaxID=3058041 RepID=UPI002671DCBF|nr:response regulator [Saccharibacillus sp. CPCC 101409]MDO3411916.1 response regulator [Saccharibacillus sp. CPCC 101409]
MKLLIADDDDQIRTGIEQGIDWHSLNIEQVITASNGIEALQKFNEFFPEIVLTDVRMPGMDGLELLRQIKQVRAQTKVIILSGYNDFQYLKTAIQLDAVDYEMKPIRARNLVALIKKVRENIVREQMTEQEFHKYLESYKRSFKGELLAGRITDRLIILEGLQQYYNFDATGSLLCAAIQIDRDAHTDAESVQHAVHTFCQIFEKREWGQKGIALTYKKDSIVLLFKLETPSYLYFTQTVNELLNQLRGWNKQMQTQGFSFSAGVSGYGNAADFADMQRQAEQALALKLYEGRGSIQARGDTAALKDETIGGLLEDERFVSALSQGDFSSLIDRIAAEFERLRTGREYSRNSIAAYVRSLLQFVLVAARHIPGDAVEQIHAHIAIIDGNLDILTLDDFRKIALSTFEQVGLERSKELSPVMIRAEEFIRKHYTQDLTVEMLAEHVGKTPNYFSHRFKREFGVSFKEYVTRLRIAKAKELILHTNDLLYEISEQIGFADYIYFTQVFKKIEGCSPASLRKAKAPEKPVPGNSVSP